MGTKGGGFYVCIVKSTGRRYMYDQVDVRAAGGSRFSAPASRGGWRLEKKSQTAYRFKKKEGRALVALLSFLCNRNEVSYYIKKSVFWQENWSYQIPDGRLHKNRTVNIVQNSVDFTEKVC